MCEQILGVPTNVRSLLIAKRTVSSCLCAEICYNAFLLPVVGQLSTESRSVGNVLGKGPMSDLILCSSVILKYKSSSKHKERPSRA